MPDLQQQPMLPYPLSVLSTWPQAQCQALLRELEDERKHWYGAEAEARGVRRERGSFSVDSA